MEAVLDIFPPPSLISVSLKRMLIACDDSQLQFLLAVFSERVVTLRATQKLC
jgi:hypothetical protein